MSTGAARCPASMCRAPPIPARMREDVGGGVFNALRNAVQRGIDGVADVGARRRCGRRHVARAIAAGRHPRPLGRLPRPRHAELHRAHRSRRRRDRRPRRHGALRDRLRQAAAPLARRATRSPHADAILCDANLPAAALERLGGDWPTGKPLFAIAISPAKAVRLTGVLGSSRCLFMNRREAAALAGAPRTPRPRPSPMSARAGLSSRRHHGRQRRGDRLRCRRHLLDRAPCACNRWPTRPAPAMRWPA